MMKQIILLSFLSINLIHAEPLTEAPKDLATLNVITGFHSQLHKQSGFEFKIFEIDGSGSVAFNPTYLYLGITNNQFGDDEQSTLLKLPNVSKVVSIKFSKDSPKIEIHALFDQFSDDSPKNWTVPGTIKINIPLKKTLQLDKVDATIIYQKATENK